MPLLHSANFVGKMCLCPHEQGLCTQPSVVKPLCVASPVLQGHLLQINHDYNYFHMTGIFFRRLIQK
ncbi:hypothetical protein BRADI_1g06887v3 [Brachypodium distachyon]|uniref:Uncharacterized protein n=1 Tax=Brachypodium distachyon TaxID=15368 RepID=A0A2K2DIF5_BRADI|nr:hypothetical protein BRADI_1g06887v3 [Brachypodium distachyon]